VRRLFGLALFAACAPAPVTLELPEVGTARALLVAVERGGELIEIAAFDVDATDPLGPQALLGVADDEVIGFTVLGLELSLNAAGVEPGRHPPSSNEDDLSISALATVGIKHADVSAGVRTAWEPVTELTRPVRLGRIASRSPCRRFEVEVLDPVDDKTTFIVPLHGGNLLGTSRRTLHFVPATGPIKVVTPGPDENGVRFPTWSALPVTEIPGELWMSGESGEMWQVSFRETGGLLALVARTNVGIVSAVQFMTGHADRRGVDLYFITLDGTVAHFDGTTTETLHAFPQVEGLFISGGIVFPEPDTFIAVRNSSDKAVVIKGGVVTQVPVGEPGVGIYGIGFVPSIGTLVSDAGGKIFVKTGRSFEAFGQSALAVGAQAIVPLEGGFLLAGAQGAIQEWRTEGGFCPVFPSLVEQSLRFWSPRANGDGWIVSGPNPREVGMNPVTIYREKK